MKRAISTIRRPYSSYASASRGDPAAQLAHGLAVVVRAPQVVLVERREGAVERQDLEAVARQLEVADDLRPQQAHHVAGDAEAEAREDLLGHGRATQDVAALQDQRLQAAAGKVCRGHAARYAHRRSRPRRTAAARVSLTIRAASAAALSPLTNGTGERTRGPEGVPSTCSPHVLDMHGRNSYRGGMKATVSEKGQVTIPKAIRTRLGIRPGSVLEFDAEGGRLVARKATQRDALDEIYGALRMEETVDAFIERIRGR